MKYSHKIKEILHAREINQDKLAQELGVTFAALNRWINADVQPRASNARKIDALYQDLFGTTKNSHSPDSDLKAKSSGNDIDLYTKNIIQDCKKINIKNLLNRKDFIENIIIKFTHATNRLEGSTMTESEVRDVLYENLSFSHRSLIEHIEAKNHETALLYVLDNYKNKITEDYIKKLHLLLMNSIKSDAGSYRNHNVRIVGSFVPTTNHLSINKRMQEFIKENSKYNNSIKNNDIDKRSNVFIFLAQMHAEFEMIHPFSDGNGRVGRLLLAHTALQNGILPIIILAEYRSKYIKALQKAQLENIYDDLSIVIVDGVKVSLNFV